MKNQFRLPNTLKGQTLCWDEEEGEKVKKWRGRAARGGEVSSKSRAVTNIIGVFAFSRRSALETVIRSCPSVVPKSKIKCLYRAAPAEGLKASCREDNEFLCFAFSLPELPIDYSLYLEGKINNSAPQQQLL